jgi:hypothetical protein
MSAKRFDMIFPVVMTRTIPRLILQLGKPRSAGEPGETAASSSTSATAARRAKFQWTEHARVI